MLVQVRQALTNSFARTRPNTLMWFSTLKFKWKQQEKKNVILDFQFKFQPKLQQNLPVTNQHLIFEIVRIKTSLTYWNIHKRLKELKWQLKYLDGY